MRRLSVLGLLLLTSCMSTEPIVDNWVPPQGRPDANREVLMCDEVIAGGIERNGDRARGDLAPCVLVSALTEAAGARRPAPQPRRTAQPRIPRSF